MLKGYVIRYHHQCSDWEMQLIHRRSGENDIPHLEDAPPQSPCPGLHYSSRPSSYSVPWESYWDALLGCSSYQIIRLKTRSTIQLIWVYVLTFHLQQKNNERDFHEGHSASSWDWRYVEEDLRVRKCGDDGCRRPRTLQLVTNCPRQMSGPARRRSLTCAKCAGAIEK